MRGKLHMNRLKASAVLMMLSAPWPALAESALPYLELLHQSQTSAPRLLEQNAAVQAAAGRADQAGAWANPSASIELEDFAGTGQYKGSPNRPTA